MPEHLGEGATLYWDHFDVEMADAHLPVVVRSRDGLDFAYTDELREVFCGISEREVLVDLRKLTFVDSARLSVLLSARRTSRDVGARMAIRRTTGRVPRVFEAAELAEVLDD